MNKDKKVLVLGASGATGLHAVMDLLDKNYKVKAIVRSKAGFLNKLKHDTGKERLEIIEGNILNMNPSECRKLLSDCQYIISCLGHNLTFKGMFGFPRFLVRDSVKK